MKVRIEDGETETDRARERERELHPCMRERDGRRDATVVAAIIRREGCKDAQQSVGKSSFAHG